MNAFGSSMLIKDCRRIVSGFQFLSFHWICKGANKIAHLLERVALLQANYFDCVLCLVSIADVVSADKFGSINDSVRS